jgi:hypothetical protein
MLVSFEVSISWESISIWIMHAWWLVGASQVTKCKQGLELEAMCTLIIICGL